MLPSANVALVVDPDFGAHLEELVARMPVWIVDSPANAKAIQALNTKGEGAFVVTTIFANGASPEDWCVNHADTVDQHHNAFSQIPAYTTLHVIGVHDSERVRKELKELGFLTYRSIKGGFVATKSEL